MTKIYKIKKIFKKLKKILKNIKKTHKLGEKNEYLFKILIVIYDNLFLFAL